MVATVPSSLFLEIYLRPVGIRQTITLSPNSHNCIVSVISDMFGTQTAFQAIKYLLADLGQPFSKRSKRDTIFRRLFSV